MKRWTIVITALFFILCAGPANSTDTTPRVKLTTSNGEIVLALNPAAAPKTVENFLSYVNEGFYNGTIFHRVIKGFMIQGGGFTENMQQKTTKTTITNEADNGLLNLRGTLAMARTSDPHSASSQFFINTVDNDFLNFKSKAPSGSSKRSNFGLSTIDLAIATLCFCPPDNSSGLLEALSVSPTSWRISFTFLVLRNLSTFCSRSM